MLSLIGFGSSIKAGALYAAPQLRIDAAQCRGEPLLSIKKRFTHASCLYP
jgi:hypothetical protein